MPQKIEIEGVVKEFYTPEEIEAEKVRVAKEKDEEFAKTKKELDEQINPNWAEARKLMAEQKKQLDALAKQGKTINDKGEVIDLNKQLTPEEIADMASRKTREEMLNMRLGEYLDRYDAETRKVVEHYYNKLTAGETINLKNIGQFVVEAEQLAKIPEENRFNKISSGGAAPNISFEKEETNFADTEEGKARADQLGIKI